MWTIVIALLCGVIFTLWLANRQSSYQPMFTVRRGPRFRVSALWWGLVACVLVGGGLAVYGLVGLFTPPPDPNQLRAESTLAPQGPSHLIIPAIKLDEQIVAIPLTANGWDVSHLAFHVGWLESTGVKPNDSTAMAFIGHVTISAAQTGPFADLQNLKALDEVIYRSGGSDFVYAVNRVEHIKPEDVSRLFQPKGDHLLLVTCTDWNYLTENYEGRLLADAVLAKQVPSP
jgi:LPXTG-site transpeptidase (sortase) family protein